MGPTHFKWSFVVTKHANGSKPSSQMANGKRAGYPNGCYIPPPPHMSHLTFSLSLKIPPKFCNFSSFLFFLNTFFHQLGSLILFINSKFPTSLLSLTKSLASFWLLQQFISPFHAGFEQKPYSSISVLNLDIGCQFLESKIN